MRQFKHRIDGKEGREQNNRKEAEEEEEEERKKERRGLGDRKRIGKNREGTH